MAEQDLSKCIKTKDGMLCQNDEGECLHTKKGSICFNRETKRTCIHNMGGSICRSVEEEGHEEDLLRGDGPWGWKFTREECVKTNHGKIC